jgi:hypothetical protein
MKFKECYFLLLYQISLSCQDDLRWDYAHLPASGIKRTEEFELRSGGHNILSTTPREATRQVLEWMTR